MMLLWIGRQQQDVLVAGSIISVVAFLLHGAKRARKGTTYIRYQISQQSFKKSTPFLSHPSKSQERGIGLGYLAADWLAAAGCCSVLGLLAAGSPKTKLKLVNI
jgi:hypothetical protein